MCSFLSRLGFLSVLGVINRVSGAADCEGGILPTLRTLDAVATCGDIDVCDVWWPAKSSVARRSEGMLALTGLLFALAALVH